VKLPLSWLREYVDVEASAEELAVRLSVATCEVERITQRGVPEVDGNLGLFRVGRVLAAEKHPNADRLQLTQVEVGEAEPLQIVCGAWNFGAGATVAVAMPGAVLPGGLRLERRKLRGEVSEGMILSEDEVELGTDHSGIMVLAGELEPGTPLGDVLPLVEEVLEVEVTPNRPDLLSVYGMAREVAALFGGTLAPPPGADPEVVGDEQVDIRIDDFEGCPRYIGRLFREVRIGPSPVWMKARLLAAGMRPISNVVDVTNYVMLALGNPLHAFDHDLLAGGRIVVRRADEGEALRTLDGQLRALDSSDLMIADGERSVALAGIMGGEETEVTGETTNVLLEAANFEPVSLLRTSERLGLRTEGSNRWEKGVDPYLAGQAATLATELMVKLTGARWTGSGEARGELPGRPAISFRPERASTLMGLDVPPDEQRGILERLAFEVNDDWEVTVPTWRARDVTREVDLVEEVARFRLDDVPFTLPRRQAMFGRLSSEQRLRRVVEDVLVGAGLNEAYTSSLVASDPRPDALRLPAPLSAEQAVLRSTLLPSLVEVARRNAEVGNHDVALFEIARVYLPPADPLPDERWRVAAVVEGGFAAAKAALETLYGALKLELRAEPGRHELLHPGKAAQLPEGWLGELHPSLLAGRWGAFELDLAALGAGLPSHVRYEDVFSFPAVRQDLAFVVGEGVTAAELVSAMREAAGAALREVRAFDEYRSDDLGPERKSLAFAVAFQSPERTLTDEDAAGLRGRIVEALAERFGAVLRA
jgi:phenylalanyl-tRNA synthetase beta chain